MSIVKKIEDQCPNCGEDHSAVVDDYEVDCDCLCVLMHCRECGEVWREYFLLKYDGYTRDGHVYNADGEEERYD